MPQAAGVVGTVPGGMLRMWNIAQQHCRGVQAWPRIFATCPPLLPPAQKRRARQAAHMREVERLLAYRRQLYEAMRVGGQGRFVARAAEWLRGAACEQATTATGVHDCSSARGRSAGTCAQMIPPHRPRPAGGGRGPGAAGCGGGGAPGGGGGGGASAPAAPGGAPQGPPAQGRGPGEAGRSGSGHMWLPGCECQGQRSSAADAECNCSVPRLPPRPCRAWRSCA